MTMGAQDGARRWIPKTGLRSTRDKKSRAHPFMDDPSRPDPRQARKSAYDWHGRMWSPFLYCYACLGCKIANESFRKGLIKEIILATGAVAANPGFYNEDEPAKLRNLRKCVETGEVKRHEHSPTAGRKEEQSFG